MFRNGSLVTLSNDKIHGEGADALKLNAGTCGLVVRETRSADGNHRYIVEFGAYGQWHCTHNELDGDDPDGWDQGQSVIAEPEPNTIIFDPLAALEEAVSNMGEKYEESSIIDVEEDIRRRVAQLEKEIQ